MNLQQLPNENESEASEVGVLKSERETSLEVLVIGGDEIIDVVESYSKNKSGVNFKVVGKKNYEEALNYIKELNAHNKTPCFIVCDKNLFFYDQTSKKDEEVKSIESIATENRIPIIFLSETVRIDPKRIIYGEDYKIKVGELMDKGKVEIFPTELSDFLERYLTN